jgi:catechol 2,3-dioxygenase-like lactoylglutathione lyase family enzyme
MLDHIGYAVTDIDKSKRFYLAAPRLPELKSRPSTKRR